jgi:hypothetical protein
VIRDLFTDDVKRVVVDSRKMYRDIQKYLKEVSSDLHKRVEYYRGKQPIFDYFDIEKDIQRSIEKKCGWTTADICLSNKPRRWQWLTSTAVAISGEKTTSATP